MSRIFLPCRVCSRLHRNPRSSSICEECGQAESQARLEAQERERCEYEESPFGRFMAMPESERWEWIFERLKDVEL